MTRWRLLLGSVLLAGVVAAAWMWWVAAHPFNPTHRVDGPSVHLTNGSQYTLVSETSTDLLVDRDGLTQRAEDGTVYVLVTLDYDASAITDPDYTCSITLWAGHSPWNPTYFYSPPEPQQSHCDAGSSGQVVAAFAVPRRYLDQVDGVGLLDPGADIGNVVINTRPR